MKKQLSSWQKVMDTIYKFHIEKQLYDKLFEELCRRVAILFDKLESLEDRVKKLEKGRVKK